MNKKIAIGTCRFCGQQGQVEVPEEATQEYIDQAVIRVCNCKEARHETKKHEKLERVGEYIDNLFMDDMYKAKLFHNAVGNVYDAVIKKIQIKDWEWTYSIFMDGDDMIHIDRQKNVKEETAF